MKQETTVWSGVVRLRQASTGEERDISPDFWAHSQPSVTDHEFLWTEGNYSCDCNRAVFWALAGAEPPPGAECGDGAYLIVSPEEWAGER